MLSDSALARIEYVIQHQSEVLESLTGSASLIPVAVTLFISFSTFFIFFLQNRSYLSRNTNVLSFSLLGFVFISLSWFQGCAGSSTESFNPGTLGANGDPRFLDLNGRVFRRTAYVGEDAVVEIPAPNLKLVQSWGGSLNTSTVVEVRDAAFGEAKEYECRVFAGAELAKGVSVKSTNEMTSIHFSSIDYSGCRVLKLQSDSGASIFVSFFNQYAQADIVAEIERIRFDNYKNNRSALSAMVVQDAQKVIDTSSRTLKPTLELEKNVGKGFDLIKITNPTTGESLGEVLVRENLSAADEQAFRISNILEDDLNKISRAPEDSTASPGLVESYNTELLGQFGLAQEETGLSSLPPEPDLKSALSYTKILNWTTRTKTQRQVDSLFLWATSPYGHPRNFMGPADSFPSVSASPISPFLPYLSEVPALKMPNEYGSMVLYDTLCPSDPTLSGTQCTHEERITESSGNQIEHLINFYKFGLKSGLEIQHYADYDISSTMIETRNKWSQSDSSASNSAPVQIRFSQEILEKSPQLVQVEVSEEWVPFLSFDDPNEAYQQLQNLKDVYRQAHGNSVGDDNFSAAAIYQKAGGLAFNVLENGAYKNGEKVYPSPSDLSLQIPSPGSASCPSSPSWRGFKDPTGALPSYSEVGIVEFYQNLYGRACEGSGPSAAEDLSFPWMEDFDSFARLRAAPGGGAVIDVNRSSSLVWQYEVDRSESEQATCALPRELKTDRVKTSPFLWVINIYLNELDPNLLNPNTSHAWSHSVGNPKSTLTWQSMVKSIGDIILAYSPGLNDLRRSAQIPAASEVASLSGFEVDDLISRLDSAYSVGSGDFGLVEKVNGNAALSDFYSVSENQVKLLDWQYSNNTMQPKVKTYTYGSTECRWADVNKPIDYNNTDESYKPAVYVPGYSSVGCGWHSERINYQNRPIKGVDYGDPEDQDQAVTCGGQGIRKSYSDLRVLSCNKVGSLRVVNNEVVSEVPAPQQWNNAQNVCEAVGSEPIRLYAREIDYACDYEIYEYNSELGFETVVDQGQYTFTERQMPNVWGSVQVEPKVSFSCEGNCSFSDALLSSDNQGTFRIEGQGINSNTCDNICGGPQPATSTSANGYWKNYYGAFSSEEQERESIAIPSQKSIWAIRKRQILGSNLDATSTDYKNIKRLTDFVDLVLAADNSSSDFFPVSGGAASFYSTNHYTQAAAKGKLRPMAMGPHSDWGSACVYGASPAFGGFLSEQDELPLINKLYISPLAMVGRPPRSDGCAEWKNFSDYFGLGYLRLDGFSSHKITDQYASLFVFSEKIPQRLDEGLTGYTLSKAIPWQILHEVFNDRTWHWSSYSHYLDSWSWNHFATGFKWEIGDVQPRYRSKVVIEHGKWNNREKVEGNLGPEDPLYNRPEVSANTPIYLSQKVPAEYIAYTAPVVPQLIAGRAAIQSSRKHLDKQQVSGDDWENYFPYYAAVCSGPVGGTSGGGVEGDIGPGDDGSGSGGGGAGGGSGGGSGPGDRPGPGDDGEESSEEDDAEEDAAESCGLGSMPVGGDCVECSYGSLLSGGCACDPDVESSCPSGAECTASGECCDPATDPSCRPETPNFNPGPGPGDGGGTKGISRDCDKDGDGVPDDNDGDGEPDDCVELIPGEVK